jgi:NAD(P)-dependent dehydrogenase (short-subunit alcohol dehydrogenase family)
MKLAVVTGGGHGIGKGIVNRLLKEQCLVVALDINSRYLLELKNENKIYSAQSETFLCDVGNPDEVQSTINKIDTLYGRIDYLVNNAGISRVESIDTLSVETVKRQLSLSDKILL